MANKKSKKKNIKDSKKTPSFIPTKKEVESRAKATKLEMKRLGFNTLEEYIDYFDKNRGY